MKMIVIMFVMLLVSACADEPLLNTGHDPIKPQGGGVFIYDFKYSDDCTIDGIELCAVNSIRDRNLLPNCNNIKILKGGYAQNGWAWATLRCDS